MFLSSHSPFASRSLQADEVKLCQFVAQFSHKQHADIFINNTGLYAAQHNRQI